MSSPIVPDEDQEHIALSKIHEGKKRLKDGFNIRFGDAETEGELNCSKRHNSHDLKQALETGASSNSASAT